MTLLVDNKGLGRAWRWLLTLVVVLACGLAWSQTTDSRILEHAKAGFQLTGVHTSVRCESCHMRGVFKGTPRDCASCHISGRQLAGSNVTLPVTHVQTKAGCDNCHNTVTFTGARFDHAGIARNTCTSCHNGSTATGKPAGHIQTLASCDSCHRTSAWLPVTKPDHTQFTAATNCASCHNGSSASGKSPAHIPTALNCVSCHNTTLWKPAQWNHTQMPVANQCATCHSGAYPPADGKTANHIPYQMLTGVGIANCDTCHKSGYVNWNPGQFHLNVPVTTQCATCHLTGSYGVTSKPATATHAPITGNCESCHKSTSTWFVAKPDHSLFNAATNCTSCHNGTTATGKTPTHIPTTLNCVTCHNTTVWKPAQWNHTQMPVANQCSTCHSGAYPPADGKTANHIPYQMLTGVVIANCDTCHKSGYALWNPGKFHSSVSVTTQCATCHLTAAYGLTGKPATVTHSLITGSCESCHRSPASWLPVSFVHLPSMAVGTGTCDGCHNGTTSALPKAANHIPIPAGPARCDSCHKSQVSFAVNFSMNHAVVAAATCKSCHNGSYTTVGTTGALTKPVNHIPEATQLLNGSSMDCKACHTSTTTWTAEKMDHNGSLGNGAGSCVGCHKTGTNYLGSMTRMQLSHKSSGKADCSVSGCHRPLGNTGATYLTWK